MIALFSAYEPLFAHVLIDILFALSQFVVLRAGVFSLASAGIDRERVNVQAFEGLTVDFCHAVGADFIVRGLRAISDFESEMQLAHNNRRLAPDVDTVFFMTGVEHGFVSSTMVREIASFGGDVSTMIPASAVDALRAALGR